MLGRVYRKIKTSIFKILFPKFFSTILYEVPRVYFKQRLKLGKNVAINDNVFINAVGNVTIGNNCVISHGVSIISTGLDTVKWVTRKENKVDHMNSPIVIADNVWIAANVTICAGVTIADNIVVAAGSVVTSNLLESGSLYGGVPARLIKHLN